MEDIKTQYLSLFSEIIAKEAIILGPEIAILKAQSVEGLVIDNKGTAKDIKGDLRLTLKKLIDGYAELAGRAADHAINLIFTKYPQIRPINI